MAQQIDAAFRLIGRRNEREPGARTVRVGIVDGTVQLHDTRRRHAGTPQPRQRRPFIRRREGENVDAGVTRQHPVQRRTAGPGIRHGQQLDIAVAQHRAAVADTAVGLAGKRRQQESEALEPLRQRRQVPRHHADMIERRGNHSAFS